MHRIVRHFAFWVGYVLFKVMLNVTANPLPENWDIEKLLNNSVVNLNVQLFLLMVNIPTVYAIFFLIERYFSDQLTILKAVFYSLLVFGVAVLLLNVINYKLILPYIYTDRIIQLAFDAGSHFYHAFNLSSVVAIACSIKLVRKQLKSRINEQILKREKAVAELKFLKAQINPHFLFNTLNNIYSLARKGSKQTPEVILKLSKLMRFMLYEASSSTIPLSAELKLIEDYIALEKLRYSSRLQIEFNTSIDNANQQIAPLLLIHFVENAFKHGVSESVNESFVIINIQLNEGFLKAIIRNSMPDGSRTSTESIGMINIKRQLELLYPHHTLDVNKNSQSFEVALTIPELK